MTTPVRTWLAAVCIGAGLLSMAAAAQAEAYPERPVRLVVPYAAGGATDLVGRIVAKGLEEQLRQPVVVENRPGAAAVLGVSQVLRAAPDGYMLAVSGVSSTMLQQILGRKLPYDAQKDLNAVAHLGSSAMVVITRQDSPLKSLRQLIDQSKAAPGAVSFGSAGNASPGHLAVEYLAGMTGTRMTHVPYTGDSALISDLVAGRIDFASVAVASVFSHIKAGTVAALAITSRERLASLPEVPTVSEAGLPGYEASIWNVLALPSGTPAAVDARLNAAVGALMADRGVQEKLLAIGFTGQPMAPAEVQAFIRAERDKWTRVIRDAKITVD